MDFDTYKNLLATQEELDPELKAYQQSKGKSEQTMIQHPLVYSIFHFPLLNAYVNAQLKQKKEAIAETLVKKQYMRYIDLHERPWRLNAFQSIKRYIDDKTYWTLLAYVWIDSENIYENINIWKRCLRSKRPYRRYFMDTEERRFLKQLPNEVTVYRGYGGINHPANGLSFTLNKDIALWFSKRYGNEGNIVTIIITKDKIFAILLSRKEEEVILFP